MKLPLQSVPDKNNFPGVWYAIAAFLAWGILPIYWKILKPLPALEILAHRIVWSFVFLAILITFYQRWRDLKNMLLTRDRLLAVIACAILISTNWGIYIWAVNSDHIVDSSMGYYINPLLSVCLGMIVLRESLNFWQWVSLIIATLGVVFIGLQYGKIPWIALSLATSFGLYGLVKKMANIDAIIGLTLETMVLTPLALGYLLWLRQNGSGAFGNSPLWVSIILAGAGIVTAIPLLWFARATQLIPLSVVGFTQYLNPTGILILGIFVYHETFTPIHLIGFGAIWGALVLFSCSHTKFLQNYQPPRFKGKRVESRLPLTKEY